MLNKLNGWFTEINGNNVNVKAKHIAYKIITNDGIGCTE